MSPPSPQKTLRQALRQTLRKARRTLDEPARSKKQDAMLQAVLRHPRLRRAKHLAIYWPADGEPDLRQIRVLRHPRSPRRQLLLPVLTQNQRLRFAPWHQRTALHANRFGIPEPRVRPGQLLRPLQLDAVLMPLVGFDDQGNRLGMGGGFYDRSFAFRHARRRWRKPLLIGVAFELQRCPPLPKETWDVPLDGIVTELGLRLFHR